jgi:thymidylate synthase (methanogen type)
LAYGVIFVNAETLGEAWEKAVKSMMQEGYDRKVDAPEFQCMSKDSPMFIIVSNPMKEPKLSAKAPMTREAAEEYARNVINGMPKEKENKFDYSYFARLRCYPDCLVRSGLPNVTESEEELRQEVEKISQGKCVVRRIDQVKKAIETFKKDMTRRSVVMHTWIPMRDLEKFTPDRRLTSSPCLVLIHPQIIENKLHFFVVMKTNDLFNAWPGNAFAFFALQEYMAKEIGVEVGSYNHFSVAMQIYEDMYEQAKELMKE